MWSLKFDSKDFKIQQSYTYKQRPKRTLMLFESQRGSLPSGHIAREGKHTTRHEIHQNEKSNIESKTQKATGTNKEKKRSTRKR